MHDSIGSTAMKTCQEWKFPVQGQEDLSTINTSQSLKTLLALHPATQATDRTVKDAKPEVVFFPTTKSETRFFSSLFMITGTILNTLACFQRWQGLQIVSAW